jgi:hypothetical protein
LEGFDPILDSGITVTHIPPLIAKTGDDVQLDFIIDCDTTGNTRSHCNPDVILFTAYGPASEFEPRALTKQGRDSLDPWTVTLPAADSNGQALQYYLEMKEEKANVQGRYPLIGAIELFTASTFTTIDLPPDTPPMTEGELILHASWGSGPEQIGLNKAEGSVPEGPSAFDVAPDGRIAVLDNVNQRVFIFDPHTSETKTYPVELHGWGDIAFVDADQLLILDLVEISETPQLYSIDLVNCHTAHLGPIFISGPVDLLSNARILDITLGRHYNPINTSGDIKSPEEQIEDFEPTERIARWQSAEHSLFADMQEELIFDVQSTVPLGAIGYFGKMSDAYVMVFEDVYLRIVWITPDGEILTDVLVANQQEAPINHYGRYALGPDGGLYYMNASPTGMEIRWIDME